MNNVMVYGHNGEKISEYLGVEDFENSDGYASFLHSEQTVLVVNAIVIYKGE